MIPAERIKVQTTGNTNQIFGEPATSFRMIPTGTEGHQSCSPINFAALEGVTIAEGGSGEFGAGSAEYTGFTVGGVFIRLDDRARWIDQCEDGILVILYRVVGVVGCVVGEGEKVINFLAPDVDAQRKPTEV